MQFTAHLDELGDQHKIPHKKEDKKHIPKKDGLSEASFNLEVQKGSAVRARDIKQTAHPTHKNTEHSEHKTTNHPVHARESQNHLWQNVKDVSIRVIASVLIFIVGYTIMNWSALSLIFDSKIKQLQGIDVSEPYKNLANTGEKPSAGEFQEPLEIKNNVQEQKKQIPALGLAVTPPDMRIIIPKIGSNVPVVSVPTNNLIARDWDALENDIQDSLRDGVVHYPGTAYPDQIGNVVLTGHSSYFPWDPGRFKDVFALLHQVALKDKIVVFYDQKKYIYQVDEIKVVMPDKIDVLGPTDDSRLTLITCTPIGTNEKRLIVRARLIEGVLIDGTKVTGL